MNINALARAILERNLYPDFPIFSVDTQDKKRKVISFMIDAEKCVVFIDTKEDEKDN